jgi:hypothetical protein
VVVHFLYLKTDLTQGLKDESITVKIIVPHEVAGYWASNHRIIHNPNGVGFICWFYGFLELFLADCASLSWRMDSCNWVAAQPQI